MKSLSLIRIITICLILTLVKGSAAWSNEQIIQDRSVKPVQHVMIVVLSGISTDSLLKTYTPNFHDFAKVGVKLEEAIGVYPPSNPSALVSLSTGASPNRHGIIKSTQKAAVESIFHVMLGQGRSTMIVATDEEAIAPLLSGFHHKIIDSTKKDLDITEQAIDAWKHNKPFATLVLYTSPAEVGKKAGIDSPDYLKAITDADHQIGRWANFLKEEGIFEDVLWIITSDHALSYSHKENTKNAIDKELLLPLVVAGPKMKMNITLPPVRTIDIAPTIAHVTGVSKPAQSEGDVIWNAILPPPDSTAEAYYEQRVKDLSLQVLDLSKSAYRLAEDKLTIDGRVENLQKQKQEIEIFTAEKEDEIESLKRKVLYQRYLIGAIILIAILGFFVEYLILRKRFLMF
ncbi:alkaline phosphatase family protein [Heliorestis convoluta]|uniref:Type i phosphodiesterase/nucleotide pyrophosphatase, putative n=1 Tax=Heliorestis convoluta TaxID=356322 RepID=A0A5Q2MWT9_9FIRM|nr:alkaline phosphatase family protein [Heliorestis convoluta]QGG46958.1 Type i phosphodiesterase/nucleotide pyrophosphatase, putative [Heliorestis convoluta]